VPDFLALLKNHRSREILNNLRPLPRINFLQSFVLEGWLGKVFQEKQLFYFLKLNSKEELRARVVLAKWMLKSQPITHDFICTSELTDKKLVWKYWHSQDDEWPDIVRVCDRSHQTFFSENLITLSDSKLSQYISLPDWITLKRPCFSRTFFSDLLRLILLRSYGGTWIDSTILVTKNPVTLIKGEKFFAYSRPSDPYLLSSWFLSASLESHIIKRMLESMLAYWKDF